MGSFGKKAGRRLFRAAGILLLLTAALLTGCVKKYGRSDIASYAKKVSGSGHVTVSEGYIEIHEDEEGYLDHLWTVTDDESGITFHVLDDYYWALEAVENQLLDDYDSSVFLALLDQNKLPLDNSLSLKQTEMSGLKGAEVVCSFTDAQSLENCYEELRSLRQAADEAGHAGLRVTWTAQYRNPLRGFVDYDVDEGDTSGEIGSLDEESLAEMRLNYLLCALDFRLEDVLKTFTEEEIRAAAQSPAAVRLYKKEGAAQGDADAQAPDAAGGESAEAGASAEPSADPEGADEGSRVYYEDVVASPQYDGISFGTLYEILRQEGRSPEGDPWHYSFTAVDGSRVEISYDFHDLSGFNDAQGKLQNGYYYLRDDRKVRMSDYFANHFQTAEIEALTGLRIYEDRNYR